MTQLEVSGQLGQIVGKLIDADLQLPIPGATVQLVSHTRTESTDDLGIFRMPALPAGKYEVVVSHIGFRPALLELEVLPGITSHISIKLKSSDLDLTEIKLNSRKSAGLSQFDIKLRPVNNSQDILRMLPGLFIAQHAGGGKAEQIFLRGFDIDHGTDINITVDGMPVNMVSHAHGQGYADLHFVIPETIDQVEFDLGPYHASKGNMATAGFVDFRTRDFINAHSIKVEAGIFGNRRISGLFKLWEKNKDESRQQLYLAGELFGNKGYFEKSQDMHRVNLLGKYTWLQGKRSKFLVSGSYFNSRWDASGQIPQRAIDAALITRYGSIDDSEGGHTSRTNINFIYSTQWKRNWSSSHQVYVTRYAFDLFSNFTFFKNDSLKGDGIRQKESRNLAGHATTLRKPIMIGATRFTMTVGAGFRYDEVKDSELSKAVKRNYEGDIQLGHIREINSFAFWEQIIEAGKNLSITGGLRYDHFRFGYLNQLSAVNQFQYQSHSTLNPKINIQYYPTKKFRLFFQGGSGFHSNDSRVILDNQVNNILPKVFGTDLGMILKPFPRLMFKFTFWRLYSQQEFLYVGDEGIVEAGGRTKRKGIDLLIRYQLNAWLFADADFNMAKARMIGVPKHIAYVPLAPIFTSIGGLTIKGRNGFNIALRYRYMADRPANESKTIMAKGYFLTDLVLNHRLGKFQYFISMENILDQEWNETQFDTESRLKWESAPLSGLHITPGTPRFLKVGTSLDF